MGFSVGSVLARSVAVFFRNLLSFMALAVVIYSPLIVYTIVLVTGELTYESVKTYTWVGVAGNIILGAAASGAVTYGVFQQLRGSHASLGRCLAVGLSRMLPVVGVAILSSLAIGVGLVLLIVPGVIVACVLWVAVPAAVVERIGVFESLSRSGDLTRGYRGHVFGVVLVVGVLNFGISYVLQKVMVENDPTIASVKLFLVVNQVEGMILGMFGAVCAAVGYHDLRTAKEGVATEDLASVFD